MLRIVLGVFIVFASPTVLFADLIGGSGYYHFLHVRGSYNHGVLSLRGSTDYDGVNFIRAGGGAYKPPLTDEGEYGYMQFDGHLGFTYEDGNEYPYENAWGAIGGLQVTPQQYYFEGWSGPSDFLQTSNYLMSIDIRGNRLQFVTCNVSDYPLGRLGCPGPLSWTFTFDHALNHEAFTVEEGTGYFSIGIVPEPVTMSTFVLPLFAIFMRRLYTSARRSN
jgi:hypothetical protein